MPRYFFNVIDGRDYRDTEGTELPDLSAAEEEAVATVGEIIRDGSFDGDSWSLEVVDEHGKVALTFHFDEEGYRIEGLGRTLN
jgi:hypothetical protein